jgi:glycosyltransferase 2 family protein
MRRLQLLLLLLGVGVFVFVVQKAGLARILHGLRSVGWWFVAVFALELVIDALHSEAWRWCMPEGGYRVSRFDTLLARTAGVAINVLTPTASVGGEVVKGMLVRRWIPLADGFASVIVDKLTFALGQAIFLSIGTVAMLTGLSLNVEEKAIALVVLTLWIAAVGAFFALQRAGIIRIGIGVVRAIFGGSALLERLPGHAVAFDAKVATFLRTRHREFVASVGLHLLAQFARVPQYYVVMSALGLYPTLAACLTTAAGLVFMEATMFLIPARLGVFEGGNALIFSRLGYGATDGIIVSFTLRLSELASALLGLAALAYLHVRSLERTSKFGIHDSAKEPPRSVPKPELRRPDA